MQMRKTMPKVKCMNCKYGSDTRDPDKRWCTLKLPPFVEAVIDHYGNCDRFVWLDHGCDLGVEKVKEKDDAETENRD